MHADGFLLDPEVVYLNHGSYGACPVSVFDEYQSWQRRLERDPHDFFTPAAFTQSQIPSSGSISISVASGCSYAPHGLSLQR